jgi:cysteine desulfurase/selenocysteine lyase
MKRLGVDATARASFAFYNTHDEVEALAKGLESVVRMFGIS